MTLLAETLHGGLRGVCDSLIIYSVELLPGHGISGVKMLRGWLKERAGRQPAAAWRSMLAGGPIPRQNRHTFSQVAENAGTRCARLDGITGAQDNRSESHGLHKPLGSLGEHQPFVTCMQLVADLEQTAYAAPGARSHGIIPQLGISSCALSCVFAVRQLRVFVRVPVNAAHH
jgi:hypothetical protein